MTTPVELDAGPGLLLRRWLVDDAEQVAQAGRDADIACWNPIPTEFDHARQWCTTRGSWRPDHASWAVCGTDDRAVMLGSVSLHRIDHQQRNAEIGFWVVPGARGRGVGSGAVRTATTWGFRELGLHRVTLFHDIGNAGSCRTALATGFPQEGVHRQSYRHPDGRWSDEHSHARLAID